MEAVADTRGKGVKEGARPPPPIIFTEALVLKSGSTRKFLFQEVELLLIIQYNLDIQYNQIVHLGLVLMSDLALEM